MRTSAKMSWEEKERGFGDFWVWGVLTVGLPLTVYLRTLCPTIFVGDSGELVTGAYCLGILHPPGYPLYCLVGRLMALLPMGSVAQRLNLLSALCAALSAGLVFRLTISLGRRVGLGKTQGGRLDLPGIWAPAMLGGLLCAFSKTLWSQAVVAEVYSCHLLLLLLCLLSLIRWEEGGESRHLFFFALLLGLSLAHHTTTVLAVPSFSVFLLWRRRRLFENWRESLIPIGLFVIGLSVYLYLPLRAGANPPLAWGHPVSLGRTWAHFSRASYGSLSMQPFSWKLLGGQIVAILRLSTEQFGRSLLVLSLMGLLALFRELKIWFATTVCLFLVNILGIMLLLNFDVTPKDLYLVQVFLIPSFAMLALWAGLGAGWAAKGILTLTTPLGLPVRLLGAVLGVLILLSAVVPLRGNLAASDRSREHLAADLGKNILATLQPDALLFTSRDTPTFSLAHARIVEGLRPDVSLRHTGRADIFRHLKPLPEPVDPGQRAIFGVVPEDLPKMPGWTAYQVGIVYQLRRAPMDTEERLEIWDRYDLRAVQNGYRQEDFFQQELVRNYATARGNLAQDLAGEGRFRLALGEAEAAVAMDTTFFGAYLSLGNVHFQMGNYEQAARAYDRSLRLAPDNVEVINNLALARGRMGDTQGAIQLYQRSIALAPGLPKAHNDLGLAYKAAGLYPQAIAEYQRAIQLDLNYADPLRNLGVIYAYHQVDVSRAISLWERYLDLNPDDPEKDEIAAEIRRMRNLLEKQ